MYSNQLVAVVKCNGKIMREKKNDVFLPFGQEYSILIKNLNSRKALVNIWIDGESLFSLGSGLVVGPNSEIELERFYKTNNRFKFIEKTEEISEYRGDRIDDGLIRVEYQFERETIDIPIYKQWEWDWWSTPKDAEPYRVTWSDNLDDNSGNLRALHNTASLASNAQAVSSIHCEYSGNEQASLTNEDSAGITVKGSKSEQAFTRGYIGELESNKHVIVLNLKGFNDNKKKIETPITVSDKIRCETCGKVCKSSQNYCDKCGTALF